MISLLPNNFTADSATEDLATGATGATGATDIVALATVATVTVRSDFTVKLNA